MTYILERMKYILPLIYNNSVEIFLPLCRDATATTIVVYQENERCALQMLCSYAVLQAQMNNFLVT